MVSTRSSSSTASPNTRSSTSKRTISRPSTYSSPTRSSTSKRTAHSSPSRSSNSSPSSASSRRTRTSNPALEAKHAQLYPATARLGIKGNKTVKRSTVRDMVHTGLESRSPLPPDDLRLPSNYGGHNLSGFLLATGYESRDRTKAGGYYQVCRGCPTCSRARRRRVFHRTPPLSADILAQPELQLLFDARDELYPTPRVSNQQSAAEATTSPSPSPYPSPSPSPTLVFSSSPPPELQRSPSLPPPLHQAQTLHFDYGGYGGAHYSPTGEILVPRSDASDLDLDDLQYPSVQPAPQQPVFVVAVPILLVAWYSTGVDPIITLVHPQANANSTHIGELMLADYRDALAGLGLAWSTKIERFLDVTDHWIPMEWEYRMPIYGRNKVIYIRAEGVDVTPPDHFLDLLL
ncbi:hypothetical protein DFH06DRAFT_1329973 [Mycena polygramma]|nr:hypothetical protein DFH06DRAFT_1329973 [Mycena polygramma]